MSDLAAFVVAVNMENVSAGQYRALLDVLVDGQTPTDPYRCEVVLSFNATSTASNQAIIAAAKTEAESQGFTIGALDNKKVLAGIVGI
jgi:hypothetical protein